MNGNVCVSVSVKWLNLTTVWNRNWLTLSTPAPRPWTWSTPTPRAPGYDTQDYVLYCPLLFFAVLSWSLLVSAVLSWSDLGPGFVSLCPGSELQCGCPDGQ